MIQMEFIDGPMSGKNLMVDMEEYPDIYFFLQQPNIVLLDKLVREFPEISNFEIVPKKLYYKNDGLYFYKLDNNQEDLGEIQ